MKTKLIEDESGLNKFKSVCKEQLWLLCLLAPLLIIAVLVGQHFQANKKPVSSVSVKKSVTAVTATATAVATAMAEISVAEVALIVAKPLSELLAMEIYFDHKTKGRNRMRVSSLNRVENIENEAYNRSLTNVYASYERVGGTLHGMADSDKAKKVKEHS